MKLAAVKKEFRKICQNLQINFDFNDIEFGWFAFEGEFDPVKNKIKIDKADWLKNLKHELRHVWQVQTGILTLDGKWHGVKFVGPYGTEPWELDAKSFSKN